MSKQFEQIQSFVNEFNNGNLEAFHQHFSREFYGYMPTEGEETAADIFFQLASDLKAASSDLRLTVENAHAHDDYIHADMTLTGVLDDDLWGVPASNKHITWTTPINIRFFGDKFTFVPDNLQFPDVLEIGRKVGFIPDADKMDQPMPYPVVIPEFIMKVLFTNQVAEKDCKHLDEIKVTTPTTDVCEQCVEQGDIWPALRMCLICGFVGCCDTSKNKHMSQHYKDTGHSIFRSIRLTEGWIFCYEDNAFFPEKRLEDYS